MKSCPLCALVLAVLASACGGSKEADAHGTAGTKKPAEATKPAASGAAAQPQGLAGVQVETEIVAPEEAKAEAEAAITPENADAEFDKLKKEIESGG